MAGLPPKRGPGEAARLIWSADVFPQGCWFIVPHVTFLILPKLTNDVPVIPALLLQEIQEQLKEPYQLNRVRASNAFVEPVREAQETPEWRFVAPDEWCGLDEVTAVRHEIPIPCESF